MIPFDPPKQFGTAQVLDPNDINANIHHWVNLIKRISDQRYVHSGVTLEFGVGGGSQFFENSAAPDRTARWYSPYDVYVENAALFFGQASGNSSTHTIQIKLSTVPTGLTTSILFEVQQGGTNTTIQISAKNTSFVLKKDTAYDFTIQKAATAGTFTLDAAFMQLNIKTDRWTTDDSKPTSTMRRIDGSSTVGATNINTVLADVEADIATCNSNDKNPIPNAFFMGDRINTSNTHTITFHRCGDARISGKWGRTRISALQYTLATSSSTAAGTLSFQIDFNTQTGTTVLAKTISLTPSTARTIHGGYAAVTTNLTAASTNDVDDTADDLDVVVKLNRSSGTTVTGALNVIIWER